MFLNQGKRDANNVTHTIIWNEMKTSTTYGKWIARLIAAAAAVVLFLASWGEEVTPKNNEYRAMQKPVGEGSEGI